MKIRKHATQERMELTLEIKGKKSMNTGCIITSKDFSPNSDSKSQISEYFFNKKK